jgi:hypothetical protein
MGANRSNLSAVMPAKAGIKRVNVEFEAEVVPLTPSGDYWIVRFRGR